ncbi:MAG: DUF6439 family protein [Microcystaceae cyanobacterium]
MPQPTQLSSSELLNQLSTLELAQALAERLAIAPNDWHRLKSNRKAQAGQQVTAALVFLLKDRPQEALVRLNQAAGWLDRSISAPPCPTHGPTQVGQQEKVIN